MTVFTLTLAFMFLVVLLSIGVISSRLHWTQKSILIVATTIFVAIFYTGFTGLVGYPAVTTPPPTFRFLAVQVHEPMTNDPGAIFVWLLEDRHIRPRALELPYSKGARDRLLEARKRTQAGTPVYMGVGGPPGNTARPGTAHPPQSGNGNTGNGRSLGQAPGSNDLRFLDPVDSVPTKQ